jgi:putative SOS response-associated peptidase YedK
MCGAYGLGGFSGFKDSINMLLRFELQNKPEIKETRNIRPTMKGLIITRNSPNKGEYLDFGFLGWEGGQFVLNARSETVSTSRLYAKMFREHRCLIPASYFFEWKVNADGKSKTPYLFKLNNEVVFAFAGIFRPEVGFVILTTKPNRLVAEVHDRMPVILTKKMEDVWLNPDSSESELTDCMVSYDDSKMVSYPVTDRVSNSSYQAEDIIERVSEKPKQESLI